MKIVNVHAAKTNLSELIVQVLAGEEVVIARSGTPVAKLVPFDVPEPARKFGALAGHRPRKRDRADRNDDKQPPGHSGGLQCVLATIALKRTAGDHETSRDQLVRWI